MGDQSKIEIESSTSALIEAIDAFHLFTKEWDQVSDEEVDILLKQVDSFCQTAEKWSRSDEGDGEGSGQKRLDELKELIQQQIDNITIQRALTKHDLEKIQTTRHFLTGIRSAYTAPKTFTSAATFYG
ncbi:hypothetical protein JYU14_03000 [Simkania negevensis]|uniref:Uncharacterized protein n=1 Tax=Simkania negevensis TaxID=83561 RepID=A0ABS3AQM5_9BACT|nr:hypothetical protein [Simkania negevensis]